MDFFDWGIYKEYGQIILVLCMVTYVAFVGVATRLVFQIGRILRSAAIVIILGAGLVAPMVFAALRSLVLQETSAHYQEATHRPAVVTICGCFVVTYLIWRVVKWFEFRRDNLKKM